MKDIAAVNHAISLEEIAPIFQQKPLGDLFRGITVLTGAPVADENGLPKRLALLAPDEASCFEVHVQPHGFTKQELLDFRDRLQALDEGVEVMISGNPHVVALFASSMVVEDHEIQEMRLTFEIDPFA